ncbi:MAG: glycosyltransferase family 2 protein [Solirubrobacterales bacterium]
MARPANPPKPLQPSSLDVLAVPALTFGAIVCAYTLERLDDLVAAIESLRAQTRELDQIVVVIDHNEQLLAVIGERFGGGVTFVENRHKQGLSGARNSGIEAIDTDIVAFLDDDAEASPEWAGRIVAHYEDPSVIGAGGQVNPRWATQRPGWFPREFDWVVGCSYVGMPQQIADVRNMIGANMSLRRDVFERVGVFSTEVGRVGKKPVGCEETELCIRALAETGGRIVYDPAATVDHKVTAERATWSYFRTRCYMEGISKAHVVRLAGAGDGLSSERSYSTKILPLGVLRGIGDAFRGRGAGIGRAASIVAGLLTTSFGYARGRVSKVRV